MKKAILYILQIPFALVFLVFLPLITLTVQLQNIFCKKRKPRFVFGPNPLINNKYWAEAMKIYGYKSESWVWKYFKRINKKNDFNKVLLPKSFILGYIYVPFWAFIKAVYNFDIFVHSFQGGFLAKTPIASLEPYIYKLLGKKIIIIPYGSDFHRYSHIEDTVRRHTLIADYPQKPSQEKSIQRGINRWSQHADCIIPGFTFEGLGRWDCSVFSAITIDSQSIPNRVNFSNSDGKNSAVKIVHSPNHRTVKGTEYIIEAVNKIQKNGYKIDFILLENMQNDEVLKELESSDILIEQLFSGYALSGVEGMSYGNVVVSNLNREPHTRPFRLFSFLNESPVVSSSAEELEETLIKLITNPQLRKKLAQQGQEYCRKYHSYQSAHYLFSNIADKIWNKKDINLFNLYHPLKSEYSQKNKIETELKNNKIVEV